MFFVFLNNQVNLMMPAEGWMMSSLRPSNIIQVGSGSEKICVKLARVDPGYWVRLTRSDLVHFFWFGPVRLDPNRFGSIGLPVDSARSFLWTGSVRAIQEGRPAWPFCLVHPFMVVWFVSQAGSGHMRFNGLDTSRSESWSLHTKQHWMDASLESEPFTFNLTVQ